jgi:hypothetical protein
MQELGLEPCLKLLGGGLEAKRRFMLVFDEGHDDQKITVLRMLNVDGLVRHAVLAIEFVGFRSPCARECERETRSRRQQDERVGMREQRRAWVSPILGRDRVVRTAHEGVNVAPGRASGRGGLASYIENSPSKTSKEAYEARVKRLPHVLSPNTRGGRLRRARHAKLPALSSSSVGMIVSLTMSSLASEIGNLNRLGPALPGLRYRMPSRHSTRGR